MKVLAFLQQICCDQDEGVAGHPKLPHESAVDRTEHSPYRLLLAQHLPDLGRHFGELPFPQRWHVGIDDEIEVFGNFAKLAPGCQARLIPLTFQKVEQRGAQSSHVVLGPLHRAGVQPANLVDVEKPEIDEGMAQSTHR